MVRGIVAISRPIPQFCSLMPVRNPSGFPSIGITVCAMHTGCLSERSLMFLMIAEGSSHWCSTSTSIGVKNIVASIVCTVPSAVSRMRSMGLRSSGSSSSVFCVDFVIDCSCILVTFNFV